MSAKRIDKLERIVVILVLSIAVGIAALGVVLPILG